MTYEARKRTYQISTSEQTIPKSYQIEVSLCDKFASENVYSFNIIVMPSLDSKEINEEDTVDISTTGVTNGSKKKI